MDIPWKNLTSNTEHLRRNAQSSIRTSSPVSRQWCGESLPWKSSLDGLASSQVSHLTLSGAPKILLYCTEYNQPTTLAPTNEKSLAQWGKNLIGGKKSLNWVEWSVRVVSLGTNNRKRKTLAREWRHVRGGISLSDCFAMLTRSFRINLQTVSTLWMYISF